MHGRHSECAAARGLHPGNLRPAAAFIRGLAHPGEPGAPINPTGRKGLWVARCAAVDMEVSMTRSVLKVSAIALGAAAFASLSPISIASADVTASAPTSASSQAATSTLSLSEPAPTPSWAVADAVNGSTAAPGASSAAANGPAPAPGSATSPSVATASPSPSAPSVSKPAPAPGAATSPSVATASSPSGAAAPSLSEPAPTPRLTESSPSRARVAEHHYVRHRYARHYAWRNGHRYVAYGANPVAKAANGVVGGVADLGSIAAYPIYCFPNYGSCPMHWY